MTAEERVTYRSVLGNREFTAILLSQTLSIAGDQLARIAVAILVFQRTGSDLAASATFAISYLTYLIAGPVLAAVSDRRPRLTVMIVSDIVRAPIMLLLCFSHQPLWTFFVGLTVVGALAPAFDSARSAIQPDVLKGEAYNVGNALINVVLQLAQVLGFVLGGALVVLASVRGALAVDAATFLISAGLLLAFVRRRPAAQAVSERSGILRDTAAGFAFVRNAPSLVRYLTLSVIASLGLVAGEGLAVPVTHQLGGGPVTAGVLTAALPAGFVVGSLLVVRLPADRRLELLVPLALACLVPLALSPLVDQAAVMIVLWFVAGLGSSVNLIASSAYMQACPTEFRSRAYGVAVTGLFGSQGLVLLGAGALAEGVGPSQAVSVVTSAMALVLLLSPRLRSRAKENGGLVRLGHG